VNSAPRG